MPISRYLLSDYKKVTVADPTYEWRAELLALATCLLGSLDGRGIGLGSRGGSSELLEETGGRLEWAGERSLGLGTPDVELGLLGLENALEGGERLDEELVLELSRILRMS